MADQHDHNPFDQQPHQSGEAGASRAPAAGEKADFRAYLLGGPKVDDFSIERDHDVGRDIELLPVAAVQP